MTQAVTQRVEGTASAPAHMHEAVVHAHDHYHVSHYHGGLVGEFKHRAFWHTHEHNHLAIEHGHDYDLADEEREHGKEAHIHDHAAPATSPA